MERIIAIANQKGGVGKTTTAINLAACLAETGKRVLAIDIDPQGNMTSGFGVEKGVPENGIYQLLMGDCQIQDCVIRTICENLDLIPSDVDLAGAEVELIGINNREYLLREKIKGILGSYDYAVIDCPPSLSMLTINAMTTADTVLVPIQCEFYALEGLSQLMYTIELVRKRLNNRLRIEGVVFTMYDARTNLSIQVVDNVRNNLKQHIYSTVIPRNIRLAEAPSHGLPIHMYDPRSTGAIAYRRLAQEIIDNKQK